MPSKREDALKAVEEYAVQSHVDGHKAGVIAGRAQLSGEVNDLIQKERDGILAQGREEGRNSLKAEIEVAREDGRVMGVEEGRIVGKDHADKALKAAGFKEGEKKGQREGYKKGRGEGYKNGWNDAISSPPSAHKPK